MSAIATRVYNMGGDPTSSPQHGEASTERTPLIPDVERGANNESSDAQESESRSSSWLADNAVAILGSVLVTAVIAIICVFLVGGNSDQPSRCPQAWILTCTVYSLDDANSSRSVELETFPALPNEEQYMPDAGLHSCFV